MALEKPSLTYHWQETSPGTWERKADECELFYKLSTRKENGCFPVTACASFALNTSTGASIAGERHDTEIALRKAWITLYSKYPTLRSYLKLDESTGEWKRAFSPFQSDKEETQWLQSTFKVIDVDVSAPQWFNDDAPWFEEASLFLVRSKQEDDLQQTVFLRCPHDVTDGIGVLQLLDQLFQYAASAFEQGDEYAIPGWEEQGKRLSPCLRIAASIPERLDKKQRGIWEQIQQQNGQTYNHPNLLGLPSSSSSQSSTHKIHRVFLFIPKLATEKILRKCKEIAPGVSVTHVFVAAFALELAELQLRREGSYPARFVYHSMINLRPYCGHPYSTVGHAAATYHSISAQALGLDISIPTSHAHTADKTEEPMLQCTATKVRDYFEQVRPIASPADAHEQVTMASEMFRMLTPKAGSGPYAVSEPLFCPAALSSIGNVASIVADRHGPFELNQVWAASEPIGAGVALFLSCWDDMIELSATFDVEYHCKSYIWEFLNQIIRRVSGDRGTGAFYIPGEGFLK